LIQRDYFVSRDVIIGGIRFDSSSSNLRASANATYRTPFAEKWRLESRFRVIYANNFSSTLNKKVDSWDVMPAGKAEYNWTKKTTFEAEAGIQVKRGKKDAGEDFDRPFVTLGYRFLF